MKVSANAITYEEPRGGPIRVRVLGRIVGSIRIEAGGWRYYPKGHTTGGALFPTLPECKESLEADDE